MEPTETNEKNGKIFKIPYKGMELEFKLFTIEYILSELNKSINNFESIYEITIPEKNIKKHLRDIYMNGKKEKYHYFAYIKFFQYEGKEYGLVGGKTNYPRPDISFDYLGMQDNRISRAFLKDKDLKWSRKIVIINHATSLERIDDDKQARFIECFVQRKFNLFDS